MMNAYSSYTDQQLTALLKEADDAAFTELYNRYWKKMLLVAWNHCKDKAQAEDVVHEVFLSLWHKKDQLDVQSIPAFLTTCIKFGVFKHYQREHKREMLALQNYKVNEATDDEEKLDALFLKEYIEGIVEQLPEKCRLTFQYSRIDGLSNAEIAEKMQISEKGVEANLTRALKVIKGNLKDSSLLLLLSAGVWKDIF